MGPSTGSPSSGWGMCGAARTASITRTERLDSALPPRSLLSWRPSAYIFLHLPPDPWLGWVVHGHLLCPFSDPGLWRLQFSLTIFSVGHSFVIFIEFRTAASSHSCLVLGLVPPGPVTRWVRQDGLELACPGAGLPPAGASAASPERWCCCRAGCWCFSFRAFPGTVGSVPCLGHASLKLSGELKIPGRGGLTPDFGHLLWSIAHSQDRGKVVLFFSLNLDI